MELNKSINGGIRIMSLTELIETCDKNRAEAEKRLKEICGKSKKITYDSLINRLLKITENKLHINDYRFASFMGWLADELEHAIIVNEGCWDLTIEQIDKEYGNIEYWRDQYENFKDEVDAEAYKTVEEFKDSMLDWSYTYSLDGSFASLECEYKDRKNKGLIY